MQRFSWFGSVERQGYAACRDAFSLEQMHELAAALDVALAHHPRAHGLRHPLRDAPALRPVVEAMTRLADPLFADAPQPVRAVRVILFDKHPRANWKVPWHQDRTIAVAERAEALGFGPWSVKAGIHHVQPPRAVLEKVLTLRLHIDACEPGDGPLRVLPGSHRLGLLDDAEIERAKRDFAEHTCVMPAGGVLAMRPLLLHASSPADHPTHRRVLHVECAAAPLPPPLRWPEL